MFNKQAFNRNVFETTFAKALEILQGAEKVTRKELLDLSRSTLEAFHCTEDVAFINRLIDTLTPINRRACVEYFKEFSGFHFDDATDRFTKKNKQLYTAKAGKSFEFLAEPHNNIWTWADIHLDVEPAEKPYNIDAISKYMEGAIKKAEKNGFDQKAVFKAILAGGMSVDTMLDMMDELGFAEVVDAPASPVNQPSPF